MKRNKVFLAKYVREIPMVEVMMDELNDNKLMNNVEISIYNLYLLEVDRMYY